MDCLIYIGIALAILVCVAWLLGKLLIVATKPSPETELVRVVCGHSGGKSLECTVMRSQVELLVSEMLAIVGPDVTIKLFRQKASPEGPYFADDTHASETFWWRYGEISPDVPKESAILYDTLPSEVEWVEEEVLYTQPI